jgi:hypothetical protein
MKRAVALLALLSAPALATALRPFAGMRGDASLGSNSASGAPGVGLTFDLVAGATTPNNLSDSLTVNGTAMTLLLACDAQGISGINWTCRDANGAVVLTEAGTGSSPTTTTLTPFHAHDSAERGAVYTSSGKVHAAATSSVGDLTTEDMAVEFVYKATAANNGRLVDKGLLGTDGWTLRQGVASISLSFDLRTASTTTSVSSATVGAGQWYHGIVFVDRDEATTNGSVFYTNGSAGTGANLSARSGSLTNATALNVGGSASSATLPGPIATLRVWRCPTGAPQCFAGGATNPTQWAPIARQRTAVAFGMSPSIALGSSAPSALTRATTAHVDVVDGSTRQLYLVGTGAPRIARRTHSSGTAVVGYMSEPAVSNIALQSQTLGTTWTAITVGDNVLADAFTGADLSLTGDNVDGDNTASAEHGLRQGITLTAATHTFSAWAKPGTQSFVALRNSTIANGAAWFNMSTCATCPIGEDCAGAVGTVQTGVSQATASRWPIDTTGDGIADENLCRVSVTYLGTAALNNHDLLCAPSDGVLAYLDADATADCGFWGVRVEAFPTPTSYLATTTAAAARNADDVRFDGAGHYTGNPSTMDVAVLCPSFNTGVQSTFVSVGTGAANYARLGVDATADRGQGGADVAGVQWLITAPSGDVSDGLPHSLRQTMATNNIQAYIDAVSIGTDLTATLPTVASSFVYLGTAGSTASQSACLLSRTRLWSFSVAP